MRLGKWIKISLIFFPLCFFWNYGPLYFTKQEREWRKERQEEKEARAEFIPYVNEITSTFAKKMQEKFQLVATCELGEMHRKVEKMGMEFTAYRRATIEEARALQLLVMDQFLKDIHAHEKLKPFLKEKPFTINSIRIVIYFKGPNGQYCDESVSKVVNVRNRGGEIENRNQLYYYATDPYEEVETSKILAIESYSNALKIIHASTDLNPLAHETRPVENAIDQICDSFINDMQKNYHLQCYSIGGKIPGMLEEIGGHFTLIKHMSQEEARALLLAVSERLVETINTSKELKPYLVVYPFPTDRLKLRIRFTQSNYYSYYDGSMVRITLENDKITYFKILPEDTMVRKIPFYEEHYREARKALENRELQATCHQKKKLI